MQFSRVSQRAPSGRCQGDERRPIPFVGPEHGVQLRPDEHGREDDDCRGVERLQLLCVSGNIAFSFDARSELASQRYE